ncbi:hypothetical protein AGMMS49579_03880 [Spirochaetia bacterium]|nr:hypothetical protein AGMMS49579_03880 [Spirochaetia bacterium]
MKFASLLIFVVLILIILFIFYVRKTSSAATSTLTGIYKDLDQRLSSIFGRDMTQWITDYFTKIGFVENPPTINELDGFNITSRPERYLQSTLSLRLFRIWSSSGTKNFKQFETFANTFWQMYPYMNYVSSDLFLARRYRRDVIQYMESFKNVQN